MLTAAPPSACRIHFTATFLTAKGAAATWSIDVFITARREKKRRATFGWSCYQSSVEPDLPGPTAALLLRFISIPGVAVADTLACGWRCDGGLPRR